MARQYGREPDPEAYVATLRGVFAEARRVLADEGTCWLNLGDSYSVGGGARTGLHAYLGPHLTAHKVPGMSAKNLLLPLFCGGVSGVFGVVIPTGFRG